MAAEKQVAMRFPGHRKNDMKGGIRGGIRVGSRVKKWDPGVQSCVVFQGKRWDPIPPTHAYIILKARNEVFAGGSSRILPALWYGVRPFANIFSTIFVKM